MVFHVDFRGRQQSFAPLYYAPEPLLPQKTDEYGFPMCDYMLIKLLRGPPKWSFYKADIDISSYEWLSKLWSIFEYPKY